MMTMELWTLGFSDPEAAMRQARRAEAAGWSGMVVVDSQNLAPDSYVALAAAAGATRRLGLGTGVTNPVTRHPAVTASAIAGVQRLSGGRAVLGIGRGDSALAHLGRAPAPVKAFEHYLDALQRYLRGESIPYGELGFHETMAPAMDALELAGAPGASRIGWLREEEPKVPVEVAATGPRVIAAAARHADGVMLSLGAVPERLAWGIARAREACEAAGRDPAELRLGAYVNLVCHPDRDLARHLVRGGLSSFARFSVMHGEVAGPAEASERQMLDALHRGYDMRDHTRSDSAQAGLLTPEFIDRFAIAGPPEHCVERLESLAELGLGKVILTGASVGSDREAARTSRELFDREVLPAIAPATPPGGG